jgi:hypothetical protein
MIVFEFEQDVMGNYEAYIANIPYQLTPVSGYPKRLYYIGEPPPQGPISINLILTSEKPRSVFLETYTPVVCGPQEKQNDDGDESYQPPPINE